MSDFDFDEDDLDISDLLHDSGPHHKKPTAATVVPPQPSVTKPAPTTTAATVTKPAPQVVAPLKHDLKDSDESDLDLDDFFPGLDDDDDHKANAKLKPAPSPQNASKVISSVPAPTPSPTALATSTPTAPSPAPAQAQAQAPRSAASAAVTAAAPAAKPPITSDDIDDDALNDLLDEVDSSPVLDPAAQKGEQHAPASNARAATIPQPASTAAAAGFESDTSLSLTLDDGFHSDHGAAPKSSAEPPKQEADVSGSVSRIQPRSRRQPVQVVTQQPQQAQQEPPQQHEAEPSSTTAAIRAAQTTDAPADGLNETDEFVLGDIDGLDFSAMKDPVADLDFLKDTPQLSSSREPEASPAILPQPSSQPQPKSLPVAETKERPTPKAAPEPEPASFEHSASEQADASLPHEDEAQREAYYGEEESKTLTESELQPEAEEEVTPVAEELDEETRELMRLKALPTHELINFTPLLQAVLNGYQNLRVMSLTNCYLEELPATVPPGIEVLDISHNNFTSLASISARCPSLVVLIARHNHLTSLQGIDGLANTLRSLDVSHNPQLKSVSGLANMQQLLALNLGWTGIPTLQAIRPLSMNNRLRELVLAGTPFAETKLRQSSKVVSNLLPQLAYYDGCPLENPVSQASLLFGHSSIASVAASYASTALITIPPFHDTSLVQSTPSAAAAARPGSTFPARTARRSSLRTARAAGASDPDRLIEAIRALEITYDPEQDEPLPEDLAANSNLVTAAAFLGHCEDPRLSWLENRELDWPPALDASVSTAVLNRESALDAAIPSALRPFTDPAFHPNALDIVRATELWSTSAGTWKKVFNRYTSTHMPTPVVTGTSATIENPNAPTMELVQFVRFIRAFGIAPEFIPDVCVCAILQLVIGPAAVKPRTAPVLSYNQFFQFLVRMSLYVAYRLLSLIAPVPPTAPPSDLALSVTSAKASEAVRRAAMDATLGNRIYAGTLCPEPLLQQVVAAIIQAIHTRVTDATSAVQQVVPSPDALFERIRKQMELREQRVTKMREENLRALMTSSPITQFTFQAVPLNKQKSFNSTGSPRRANPSPSPSRQVSLNRSFSLRLSLVNTPRAQSPGHDEHIRNSSPGLYRDSVATSGRGPSFGTARTGRALEYANDNKTQPSPRSPTKSYSYSQAIPGLSSTTSPRKQRLSEIPTPQRASSSQLPQPIPEDRTLTAASSMSVRQRSHTVTSTASTTSVPTSTTRSGRPSVPPLNTGAAMSEIEELRRKHEEDRSIIEKQQREVEEIRRQVQELLQRQASTPSHASNAPPSLLTSQPARSSFSQIPTNVELPRQASTPQQTFEDGEANLVDDSMDEAELLRKQLLESVEADLVAPVQQQEVGGGSQPAPSQAGSTMVPEPPALDESFDLEADAAVIQAAEEALEQRNSVRIIPAPQSVIPDEPQPESPTTPNTGAGSVFMLGRRRSSVAPAQQLI